MVEETGNNNPIVNATKALATHVDKVGEKIQSLIDHEKTDDLKKERTDNKEAEKEVKRDQYNRRLQGAEVQLTRDAAIVARNSDKQITKLVKTTPGEGKGKLAGEEKQEKTISVLERLRQTNKEFIEIAAAGFEESISVFRERVKQAFDNNSGLSNFMDAVKGDFSIMLGSLNALQQVPGFNILKTALFTVGGFIFNRIGSLIKFLKNDSKLSRKEEKKLGAAKRRLEKKGLTYDGKTILDKDGNIMSRKKIGFRNKQALKTIDKSKRIEGGRRRGSFRKGMTKIVSKIGSLFRKLYLRLMTFMILMGAKALLIIAGLVAIAAAAYLIYNNWNKLMEYLGFAAKNELDRKEIQGEVVDEKTGIKTGGIQTQETFFGRNKVKGEDGVKRDTEELGFNKNFFGLSSINEDWLKDNATTSQLLALLREEGDDISLKDRRAIESIVKERLDKGKGVGGRVLEGEELKSLVAQRNAFNQAQQELFQAQYENRSSFVNFDADPRYANPDAAIGYGNSLQNMNYYNNQIIAANSGITSQGSTDQNTKVFDTTN